MPSRQGFLGKKILERDVERALRTYLSQPFGGDPGEVRTFKSLVRQHQGERDLLFESAPRPSSFRSVLIFLRVHPTGFRKALNLVTPRLLSLWLSAYQSSPWNRTVGRYLESRLRECAVPWLPIRVVAEELPLYRELLNSLLENLSGAKIPQLHHRAV